MNKYYLEIEFRYTYYVGEGEDREREYETKKIHSDIYDNIDDCIKLGNDLIKQNNWMIQFPGCVGANLNKKYGMPLEVIRLKNGAEIYISVRKLNVLDFDSLNDEINKFNLPIIKKRL